MNTAAAVAMETGSASGCHDDRQADGADKVELALTGGQHAARRCDDDGEHLEGDGDGDGLARCG